MCLLGPVGEQPIFGSRVRTVPSPKFAHLEALEVDVPQFSWGVFGRTTATNAASEQQPTGLRLATTTIKPRTCCCQNRCQVGRVGGLVAQFHLPLLHLLIDLCQTNHQNNRPRTRQFNPPRALETKVGKPKPKITKPGSVTMMGSPTS